MQIRVPRNTIFEQMPRSVRRSMVGEDVPEFFEFEVDTFQVGRFNHEDRLRAEFPELRDVFGPIEWYIFCMLGETFGMEVPYTVLAGGMNDRGASDPMSKVVVHVKNMRRKIEALGVPLEIVTRRGGMDRVGSYCLKKI